MTFITFLFFLRSEESPEFYLMIGNYSKLKSCLMNVSKWNGVSDEAKVDEIVRKLRETKENQKEDHNSCTFSDFLKIPKYKYNLIALIFFFGFGSLGYFLVTFYMAKSPGDIYLNFGYMGFADLCSALLVWKV